MAKFVKGDDVVLCQITSKSLKDNYTLSLQDSDFQAGGLNQPSNIRPHRLFTADSHIILYRVGNLTSDKTAEVINKIIDILQK